jgi:hypothetical protein
MGQLIRSVTPPLTDPNGVQIIFSTGLADARIWNPYYMLFTGFLDVPELECDGAFERQVAFKIAMERPNVPAAIRLATARVGIDMMNERLPAVMRFAA